MKSLFFRIIFSFFLFVVFNSLTQNYSLMAQPQSQDNLLQELQAFSLPAGTITKSDIPPIKTVIQQVLKKISENKKSAGQTRENSEVKPFVSGILIFQDWLKEQGCVDEVSIPYVQPSGEYLSVVFKSYPGEVPINIFFNTGTEQTEQYRLLVYVSPTDIIKFASLIENNK